MHRLTLKRHIALTIGVLLLLTASSVLSNQRVTRYAGEVTPLDVYVEVEITWDGDRCTSRRMRWTPRTGLHLNGVPPHLRAWDLDCDDNWERAYDRETLLSVKHLHDDIMFAFGAVVPPLEQGVYR